VPRWLCILDDKNLRQGCSFSHHKSIYITNACFCDVTKTSWWLQALKINWNLPHMSVLSVRNSNWTCWCERGFACGKSPIVSAIFPGASKAANNWMSDYALSTRQNKREQPTKLKLPQIKIWNTTNQWSFCQFLECQPPIEDFLTTVLFWTSWCFSHKQQPWRWPRSVAPRSGKIWARIRNFINVHLLFKERYASWRSRIVSYDSCGCIFTICKCVPSRFVT